MSLTRGDFMKLLGVTMASLLLTRCRGISPETPSARERLRSLWFRFGELANKTTAGRNADNELGRQMMVNHRAALDELAAGGEIPAPVGDLVQESYEAAVYHVWRSNAPITCYAPMMVDYAPSGAGVLVKQAEILGQIAGQGTVEPATLEKARAALEHDMAFYDLGDEETQALYDRLIKESQDAGRPIPSFDVLELELTPDAREAARFILDLLAGK